MSVTLEEIIRHKRLEVDEAMKATPPGLSSESARRFCRTLRLGHQWSWTNGFVIAEARKKSTAGMLRDPPSCSHSLTIRECRAVAISASRIPATSVNPRYLAGCPHHVAAVLPRISSLIHGDLGITTMGADAVLLIAEVPKGRYWTACSRYELDDALVEVHDMESCRLQRHIGFPIGIRCSMWRNLK